MIQRSSIEPLNRVIRKSTGPVSMMNGHAVDCRKTIVVCEVQHYDMKDQWGMGGFDLVLGSKVEWNSILPFLKFFIKLADDVQQRAI